MNQPPTPEHIMHLGTAFWGSKTLLSAVELDVFTVLAREPMDAETLRKHLGLHERSALDFFDALVALGMLERQDGLYSNTPETALYLDKAKPSYIGGFLAMMNARLYGFWGNLTEGLKTGLPQNEAKDGKNIFDVLYSDPAKLASFMQAMTGVSMGTSKAIAQKFPWQNYRTLIDVGSAQGGLIVEVGKAHPHLTGSGFDLPVTGPIFEEYVASFGLGERFKFIPGDFFSDALPSAGRAFHGAHPARLELGAEKDADSKSLRRPARERRPAGLRIDYRRQTPGKCFRVAVESHDAH